MAQFWRRRYSPALSTEYVSCGCVIEYGDASPNKMRWNCGRTCRRTGTRAPDMRRRKQTGSAARWRQARQQLHHDRGPLSRLSNTAVRGGLLLETAFSGVGPPQKRVRTLDRPWRETKGTLRRKRPLPTYLGQELVLKCSPFSTERRLIGEKMKSTTGTT